jgi:hypothetical protein
LRRQQNGQKQARHDYYYDVGFGHIYVKAEPDAVEAVLREHLGAKGFAAFEMTPERHPTAMKQVHEGQLRLYWMSPRLGGWTGIHEFRYYSNEERERWGYTDEALAMALSKALGEVWRLEVLDGARFWLYVHYAGGEEKEGKAFHDIEPKRSADPAHPRYELNRIVDREGFRNIGLGYEHVAGGPSVPLDRVPQDDAGIEGREGFRHLAFERAAGEADHTGR